MFDSKFISFDLGDCETGINIFCLRPYLYLLKQYSIKPNNQSSFLFFQLSILYHEIPYSPNFRNPIRVGIEK